jgi:riboflavin kinase/FMN adenylyltransferase
MGMFDGVHRGHREILATTVREAERLGEPALVVTFDTHPRAVLPGQEAPPMLTSLEHRLLLFERSGLDAAAILPFDSDFATIPAERFVREYFLATLRMRGIVLGPDAHFGLNRAGDPELLRTLSDENDFEVHLAPAVLVGGRPVSSTAIREAIGRGDLGTARDMLGRAVSVLGTVVEGLGIGRTLGFPTLNLDPHHEMIPPQGVYLARTRCGDTEWNSVANIGRRSVDGRSEVLVESHLLDFTGTLYGQVVEVLFLEKLREEQTFPDHAGLAAQIARDVAAARARFGASPS